MPSESDINASVQEGFIVAEARADRADLKAEIAEKVGPAGGTCQLCGLVVGKSSIHARLHLRAREPASNAPPTPDGDT